MSVKPERDPRDLPLSDADHAAIIRQHAEILACAVERARKAGLEVRIYNHELDENQTKPDIEITVMRHF